MARRGRIPLKYMEVLRFLEPCHGYDNGKIIDEIAMKMYGKNDFQTKAMTRQLIIGARKFARNLGTDADIASIQLVGTSQRKYCHLSNVAEYTKAINDLAIHIQGTDKTKKQFEKHEKTIEERKKLEEMRKAMSKKSEEKQKQEQE
ncbi:hypothetical protein MUP77_20830 [Candidatus Bathyarchaeota archaeon]|jgi:predicted phosphoribosyltransferase|nr:hypothetical protein [Candidatus Bathyarchaeota archaeon]